jgi:2-C-methyl-D-erythritol 4-phosphate cytidylyltransferase
MLCGPPDRYLDLMEARGIVLDEDRGSLPFRLIHGEALVAAAAWSLGEAGVVLVDADVSWAALAESLADSGEALVLHDPLCPMTPPEFIVSCIEQAVARDTVVVGVRPVTDTVKAVEGGVFAATVDRDRLLAVASPVVLPARVAGELDGLPTTDLAALVEHLRSRWPVEPLEAPAEARRIGSEEELRVLEALTSAEALRPGHSREA